MLDNYEPEMLSYFELVVSTVSMKKIAEWELGQGSEEPVMASKGRDNPSVINIELKMATRLSLKENINEVTPDNCQDKLFTG